MVLVGPSGSGKSTILKMVAGLTAVTEGKIFIDDREVTRLPPQDRDIAMVFQNYALYPNMSVRRNLGFGLRMRKTPRAEIEERVNHVAGLLGLQDLLDRRPAELSGGERQRVAMGRAIVRKPLAFLLDEPLSNLDAKLRVQVRADLIALRDRLRTTTIYVTHDQAEAMALGDRIVVMEIARVAQIGTPREIYFKPQSRFVADFIGTINLIKGRVQNSQIVFPAGKIPLKDAPYVHAAENEEVDIFFRPEHADVVEPGQGHFKTTVTASFFMGDHTRLILDWTGSDYLTIEAKGNRSFKKGQAIEIRIDPAALITLKV